MFDIIGMLFFAAAVGFGHRAFHRAGHTVGVEYGLTPYVTRRAADGLHQGRFGAQETFTVSIENCNQRNFRHIKTFT